MQRPHRLAKDQSKCKLLQVLNTWSTIKTTLAGLNNTNIRHLPLGHSTGAVQDLSIPRHETARSIHDCVVEEVVHVCRRFQIALMIIRLSATLVVVSEQQEAAMSVVPCGACASALRGTHIAAVFGSENGVEEAVVIAWWIVKTEDRVSILRCGSVHVL